MPDELLLATLLALRDEYSQKQKAATNLINAIKGKASALGKISQALDEYAATNADDGSLQPVQMGIGAAQENTSPLITKMSREVKSMATFNSALKAIISAMSSEPVDVVTFSHPYDLLKATDIQDERLTVILPQLAEELDEAQKALGFSFGAALHQALAPLGLDIGGTSPRFEIGRFEVAANFKGRSASINYGKEVVIKRVALSVDAVIKGYQTAAKIITGRTENVDIWIAQFYTAWDTARQKRNAADKRANIVDCYFEMVLLRQAKTFFSAPSKSAFADYSRAQFAYDLQEIAIRPHRPYNGKVVFAHSALKNQTDNSAKSLWVPEGRGPHDGRYIGDIVFDENA